MVASVPEFTMRNFSIDGTVRVPQDHRAPGADVIDVLLAVLVPDVGAATTGEKHGLAPHPRERTHGRVHAAGDVPAGLVKQYMRTSAHQLFLG
jgi:hypothetical protein